MRTGVPAVWIAALMISTANAAPREELLTSKTVPKDPFLTNNGLTPTKKQYPGPLFALSHAWPKGTPPPLKNPAWVQAIGGKPIDTRNAAAYVAALKQYVTPNAHQLIFDYATWDAAKAGWYNEPWLGSLRESIHGTYEAGTFPPATFPGTGLRVTFDTHVLTYYDQRAAYTATSLWGESALKPSITTANAQFAEGSVIVKAALFSSDDPSQPRNWWDAAKGAAEWPLFVSVPEGGESPPPPSVVPSYLMQFDIIVKDTQSSPKTGWVFATLVYDASAPGADAWDRMVPLGAMWGNDPDVDSTATPGAALHETWINPRAPKYSTQTLGWGGRLSGPNDGARNTIVVSGVVMKNVADSSCMSCHGPSEWNVTTNKQDSFLLPSYPNPNPGPPFKPCGGPTNDPYICSPAVGSADWLKWFQNRPGTVPQDAGSVALDYDEVFAFKALKLWWAATGPSDQPAPFVMRHQRTAAAPKQRFNAYTGAPIPSAARP